MINRTKIIAITLTGALAAAALTGCGGSSSSAAPSSVSTAAAESSASSAAVSSVVDNAENGTDTLDGIYSTLLEQDPISNQFEIAAMNIEYDFGLKAEDVVSYKGVKSNDNGDAGLVLVMEAADGSWLPTSRIRWPSTATTPSSRRHRPTWRTPSSPSRTTPWSW